MGLLDGRVALITGGARGQGRAHAVTCAREGADVIVIDIAEQVETVPYPTAQAEDLEETVSQVEALDRRAIGVMADVRSQEQLDAVVTRGIAELGRIDILIANAGIWSMAPFWEMTEQAWADTVDINLSGVWRAAKAVAPHMIERQSGSIVITSSTNGFEPGPNSAHYAATKHGAIGLMRNIALELAPHGIRANAICPGAIRTPMTDNEHTRSMLAGHEGATFDDILDNGYHYHALKGSAFLSPQVIADTALYLNSELAAAVTGVAIPVDAGHLLLSGYNHEPVR